MQKTTAPTRTSPPRANFEITMVSVEAANRTSTRNSLSTNKSGAKTIRCSLCPQLCPRRAKRFQFQPTGHTIGRSTEKRDVFDAHQLAREIWAILIWKSDRGWPAKPPP